MSFYTSLTGLNAATSQMGVTSNNIANVATVGFKRSRADFGDIFATSPLQKASSTIGQGVSLKRVTQEFGQGDMTSSSNTLDLAISGDGFFPLKSQDGFQDIFTRNGSFMMNDQYNVVNSAGQRLMAASVDSSGKANLNDMNVLTIPQQTTGMAQQTTKIQLGLNFPADAAVIDSTKTPFNRNDPTSYNKSTALTVYDAGGNGYLATVYYVKTQNASQANPTNKWQTYVYVGDTLVNSSLQQATNSTGDLMYVNKYGELKAASTFTSPADIAALNSSFSKKTVKFSLDKLNNTQTSQPASVTGGAATGLGTGSADGIDFTNYVNLSKPDLLAKQGSSSAIYTMPESVAGTDSFSVTMGSSTTPIVVTSKDGTTPLTAQTIADSLNANKDFAAAYVASADAGNLKLTAIDPTATSTAIQSAIQIAQAIVTSSKPKPLVSSPQSKSEIVFDTTSKASTDGLSLTIGPEKISGTSVDDLVAKLNDTSTAFSQSYLASELNGVLRVASKSVATSTAMSSAITLDRVPANSTLSPIGIKSVGIDAPSDPALAGTADPLYKTKSSVDDLKNLFSLNVDSSAQSVSVGLQRLAGLKNTDGTDLVLSGTQVAQELTNEINRAYGDEKPFDFSATKGSTFNVSLANSSSTNSTPLTASIDLTQAGQMRSEDLTKEVQAQLDEQLGADKVTVSYNTATQNLVFTPSSGTDKATVTNNQSVIGPTSAIVQGINDQSVSLGMSPTVSTPPYMSTNDQRYGISVQYDAVKQGFVFQSGSTGDTSSVSISNIKPNSLATASTKGLGLTGDPSTYVVAPSTVDALRGIVSSPAVLTGNALAVNVDNNFSVDSTNNQFVVSVNGVTGTVVIPPKDTYTLGTFMEALQNGINNLQGPSTNGLSPQTVDGVKVGYDTAKNALTFTTGTASTSSYIKVTGDAHWGLDSLSAQFGSTSTWIKPTPATDAKGATVYIDGFGKETSSATGFGTLPEWSPIYLEKGELTFDTTGNLVSPKKGAQLDTVYLPNGKGALTVNIDYSKSTQFASPFSVLSQSQDGAPEGDLVGLAIGDDGLVNASYSNGSQKSLGKVVLVNFSNPSGLRQIGDTSYYKTSDSGTPKYGEAGSAGYGTVRSGATERANVDLTQELVDLITEQRNFQANSKAIETSESMTSTIIQIRN